MRRRVVITGIGVIAPNGIGKENFWNALKEGKSGIKKITSFDTSDLPVKIAGEVDNFNPEDYIEDRKKIRRMARFSQFAVACAKMAVEDANLDLKTIDLKKMLVVLGVSTNAMDVFEKEYLNFLKYKNRFYNPYFIASGTPNVGVGEVLNELGIETSICTISTGCASGLDSVGVGYNEIKKGSYDVAIVGSSEASITPLLMAGLSAAKIMSLRNDEPERASRPFDKLRDGGVLSEGAGFIVIEELKHALLRKAHIYCEIIGYGEMGEKERNIPGKGLEMSMRKCIKESGFFPKEIDFISAHAPSDPFLDYYETIAIKNIFGEYAYKIPVTSIKSMIGNPFGAAGVLQLIGGILAFEEGIISPTINYEYPDSLCDLDYVPNEYRKYNPNTCLINSHGFGGSNSSLLIKKYEDK
ncbi:MAG: beta-ketoacyl-[acyl-carrier-protein] synthase family protein [Candidatus Omnitrophica bacterium]|nr:beta-ketoacyl-[acyl-carrier-protein] synthase family protein [Candidatus Omnitrophota bacterium]